MNPWRDTLMKKYNCFAMVNGNCGVLVATECVGCKFYCSKAEMNRRREAANRRLGSLDRTTQRYIAEKYCEGKYPWLEGVSV